MTSNLDYKYIAYVDEAGDTGLSKVFPIDADGASEWMVLGAVVIRASNEGEPVEWVKTIRENIGARQRKDLHFRNLSPTNKAAVCRQIANLPLKIFIICSNKKNLRGYKNKNAEQKFPTKQWYYNFCIRLLLERISDFVEKVSIKEFGSPRYMKIVFSERGGHSYRHTKTYQELLRSQGKAGTLFLPKREVKWTVVHHELIEVVGHKTNAGVQLADSVTSAFYCAVDFLGPTRWDVEPAKLLFPRVARELIDGEYFHADYGVALQPSPIRRAKLTPEQKTIFTFYGYTF